MLIQLMGGTPPVEYEVVTGTQSNVTSTPLTISNTPIPLVVTVKITVGSNSSLYTFYRTDTTTAFADTDAVTVGNCPVTCSILGAYTTSVLLSLRNASATNSATVEYWVLGVKKM